MSTFIVGEAGSNWVSYRSRSADWDQARKLVDTAMLAGCDAVKFQCFSSAPVYAPKAGMPGYLNGSAVEINDIFAAASLPAEFVAGLADYCASVGIEFMCSVFSLPDLALVDPFVRRHKIASYELQYEALVRAAARSGKPVILSTGAALWEEIADAVEWVRSSVTPDRFRLTLLQCVAAYPAPVAQANVRAVSEMSRRFLVAAGISDHSTDPVVVPVLAVAHGAAIIEKHFTLDRDLPGPDHAFALEPDDLVRMVVAVREAEAALGTGQKYQIQPCETELRRFAVRSVQALQDLRAGVLVEPGVTVDVLRPGLRSPGASGRLLAKMVGKRLNCSVQAGEGVGLCMVD